ncbi:MAG: RDD family protein [Actinomycetota bacterium]|jgi:uncharacterized RDD family membrane protein YckC
MSQYDAPPPTASGPSGPRASFGIRFVAVLIDGVILGLVGAILQGILGQNAGGALSLLAGLAYWGYLEGSPSGQTVGKKVMNIRVIDFTTGAPLGVGKALLRYVGRIISTIPCLLGYFWSLWDSENQTWHDKIAGTVVVPTSAYPVAAWPG